MGVRNGKGIAGQSTGHKSWNRAINSSSETPGRKEQEMRLLTYREISEMSWKGKRLYFLEKFEDDAERWQDECDDRGLFSNTYKKLVEAIESLPDNPNLTVCVAMNEYIRKEEEMLNRIKQHFEDR